MSQSWGKFTAMVLPLRVNCQPLSKSWRVRAETVVMTAAMAIVNNDKEKRCFIVDIFYVFC